jgi:hypothetical protein
MNPRGSSFLLVGRSLRVMALAALGCAGSSFGQTALVANSPFAASGTAASSAGTAGQDFELAGSSRTGTEVSVCIFERQAKHTEWIPVGGTTDGIRVISFDSLHDKAVVMISGQRREISMRTAAVASLPQQASPRADVASSAAASPLVPVNTPPAALGTPEQQQREARMLVSDLLEIGVQQRKAYQDAKLKASQGGTAAPGN